MVSADWDRLSRNVDRNFRKDKPRTEVRMRGDGAVIAHKLAGNTQQVTTHQIGLTDAPTPHLGGVEGTLAPRAAQLSAELATITARLERGWELMGGYDCPNIQPDRNRIESLTNTWVALNEQAAILAREYVALTGGMWYPNA